jgi:hypothetical protein
MAENHRTAAVRLVHRKRPSLKEIS